MTNRLSRTLAAALLAVSVGTVGAAVAGSPAAAATCSTGAGVSVITDRGALGGGITSVCLTHGAGSNAWTLLDQAFGVTGVQRQPGFICRVGGIPADDPCVNTPPADAYWGLYHSDGKSGKWVYSSVGAGSLIAVEGGYIAVSWQDGGATEAPGVHPKPHATQTPKPTSQPAPKPTASPQPSTSTTPTPTPTTGDEPDVPDSGEPSARGKRKKVRGAPEPDAATATTPPPVDNDDADAVSAADDSTQDTEEGIPSTVTFGALGLLVVAGGTAAFVGRRRRAQ